MKYVTRGTIAAALSVAALFAASFGKAGLAGYFSDPALVESILALVAGGAEIFAGVSKGLEAPAVTAE